MLSQAKLMGFVPTTDAERARRFYVETLGLEFVEDDGFALVIRAGANLIRIARAEKFTPAPYTVLGWQVTGIEAIVAHLTAAGVSFERYSFLNQDADGIWSAPGGAKIAWFRDPDGNVLSVSEHP